MSATPWVRSMSVREAAEALHVGLADVAQWVVEGCLRARVQPGAQRPNIWTVGVCEADVREWRRRGVVRPVPVVDEVADELRAQDVLRRRRARSGWPPEWDRPGRGGRPSGRRTGVTPEDRVREVRAAVSTLGGWSGWVRVSGVVLRLGNRGWVTADSVRDVVDVLVDGGVLVERLFRPRVGRPSPEVRFADKEVL